MFNGSMFIKNVTAMVLMGHNFQPMRDHNWKGLANHRPRERTKLFFSDVSIDLDTLKWKNTRFFEYVKELW